LLLFGDMSPITLLLSTGFSFNNPLQKCHQLMRNLT
jgi:hypothetical protein